MQRLVTGIDEQGRSCVVARDAADPEEGAPGVSLVDLLLETTESPPPARPAGNADFFDIGVDPGLVKWQILDWEAGASFPMHHTDTIDFDIVLSGTMDLVLDDGVHTLHAGDCVLMMGVDHAWRVGADGCQMSVISLGTPPPA